MSAEVFKRSFDATPAAVQFTPGRVNILGEHTDYNGGMVLPLALDIGVTVALSHRDDGRVRVRSSAYEGIADRSLGEPASEHWSDYALGAVKVGTAAGLGRNGADIAVSSTLPFGSGISSSAAICVAILKAMRSVGGADVDDTRIATLARQVENDFIGVPCGIMDQMAVSVAAPNQILALDTRSLDYDLLEVPDTHHFAVIHSGVSRQLNEGRYRERKEECDAAKAALGTDDLCHITPDQLLELGPGAVFRRARHCMTEEARTLAAIEALQTADVEEVGRLINAGHASIRDDFEITVPAVDVLVADAVELGALGARQTGGGFGGCIVALVRSDGMQDWFEALRSRHPDIRWIV